MGDIADMMLDGIVDENGEYTGKNTGYPMHTELYKSNSEYGIYNYLHKKKRIKDSVKCNSIITNYAIHNNWKERKISKICSKIQQDFPKFTQWYKDNKVKLC